jgi:hypothetical protein
VRLLLRYLLVAALLLRIFAADAMALNMATNPTMNHDTMAHSMVMANDPAQAMSDTSDAGMDMPCYQDMSHAACFDCCLVACVPSIPVLHVCQPPVSHPLSFLTAMVGIGPSQAIKPPIS